MIAQPPQPGLFGLRSSNRDFRKLKSWGKNQFNNAFPAALACYMGEKGIQPVYLVLDESARVVQKRLDVTTLFGLPPLTPHLLFHFELAYDPHKRFLTNTDAVPKADLVTLDSSQKPYEQLKALEIKLTTLPDDPTARRNEEAYGCEIVIRPNNIVYLALNLATLFEVDRPLLLDILEPSCSFITDWQDVVQVKPRINQMIDNLIKMSLQKVNQQSPLLLQCVWKTKGKTAELADNCFDLFVWSDFGFMSLFTKAASESRSKTISRQERCVVWLTKMLYDFANNGKFNSRDIINRLIYNSKSDKAFAIGGSATNQYMKSLELTQPRVAKEAVQKIILGGGHLYLSPERRLDAVIVNTPGLFPE